MKHLGIFKFVLILIVCFAKQGAFAQDYLLTMRGDSLVGKIKVLAYGSDKKVQVTSADKNKIVTPIFQVKAYALKGELYKPVKGPNGYAFMKVIKDGYVSLFAFQLETQITYEGRYLLKKDGTGMEVPNISFKKNMEKFFSECREVSLKINGGYLEKKDIEKIVDQYNSCVNAISNKSNETIAVKTEAVKKLNAWDALEDKIKSMPDFDNKANALEMIVEVKNKITKAENVPNFLISGLKESINQPELQQDLAAALNELK